MLPRDNIDILGLQMCHFEKWKPFFLVKQRKYTYV